MNPVNQSNKTKQNKTKNETFQPNYYFYYDYHKDARNFFFKYFESVEQIFVLFHGKKWK